MLYLIGALSFACLPAAPKKSSAVARDGPPVLWQDPAILHRAICFSVPGGEKDQPQVRFKFVKEDLNGTNPEVRDYGRRRRQMETQAW